MSTVHEMETKIDEMLANFNKLNKTMNNRLNKYKAAAQFEEEKR